MVRIAEFLVERRIDYVGQGLGEISFGNGNSLQETAESLQEIRKSLQGLADSLKGIENSF